VLVLPSDDSECISSRTMHPWPKCFSICDLELGPVTLTFKPDLDTVKINQRAKYLVERSLSSTVIVGHTDVHTPDRLFYPDH